MVAVDLAELPITTRLRVAIDRRHLCHAKVAEAAGMTPAELSRLLGPNSKRPSAYTIERVRLAAGIPAAEVHLDPPEDREGQGTNTPINN